MIVSPERTPHIERTILILNQIDFYFHLIKTDHPESEFRFTFPTLVVVINSLSQRGII